MGSKKELVKRLKEKLHSEANIKLSKGITYDLLDETITITLSEKAIGLGNNPLNMQENAAAFEGWALALYAHGLYSKGNIILNAVIPEEFKKSFNKSHKHYNRFLYRAMKFHEQFSDWFDVCEDLAEAIYYFKEFLETNHFVNNIGKGKAGSNLNRENIVEGYFADQNPQALLKLLNNQGIPLDKQIHRQLPTGLFKGSKSNENSIFTGGKSAIDLWLEQDDTIYIFELKTNNKMIGIISELFFYANYMYDMFCDQKTQFVPTPVKFLEDCRGYGALLDSKGKKSHHHIKAYFLSDLKHPLIVEPVVKLLDNNERGITYSWLDYVLDEDMEKLLSEI